ncbi:cupin-like domain-containing protein [Aurantiacibacter spongiae]|uniref:Cupin-like domain-containing protein n=2 Tax=Aurantiacibacter spongiae TaxID=2488860 RepID=A0A3N5CV87_9SPHN|nr:cupin-like domain-containing protein [Aurantiacibacter spongiae]
MRGLVSDWPAVAAAREGDERFVDYLTSGPATRPVTAIAAPPGEHGRFFYNADLTGFNFVTGQGHLPMFLSDLLLARHVPDPPGMAVQSEDISQLLPHFARENRLHLLPRVSPRIWIGNRIRVAPHYDVKENIACCVAGRRRFTLFPPDQIGNLYPGPFELTPAGTPVSMVNMDAPDLVAHPRFSEAWKHAAQATLMPGDAIYIPYCWWHGVESLEPLSVLVNYWWNEGEPEGVGGPYDALLHAILAYRHLPPARRAVWRGMLEHYVFEANGDPAAHLPERAKGVLGAPEPGLFTRMRQIIREALG